MKKVAIVGAGVAGLTCARLLKDRFAVTVYEQEREVGGLIRCKRVAGSLFHTCGGHVFNTKNPMVNNWFWSVFDKNRDFVKANRQSAVCMYDGRFVDYPIENHVYQLDDSIQKAVFKEVGEMLHGAKLQPENFEEFLVGRFGNTLYELYFKPYNRKIWRQDLASIPLSWLEGKLPMPTPGEILSANRNRIEERSFVHSSFYYPRNNGSQFIADRLASGVDIRKDSRICGIEVDKTSISLQISSGGAEKYDYCIFCGNLKSIPEILKGVELGSDLQKSIAELKYHGTTSVFCETDNVPYSWFYQPSPKHDSHRFICTGNFAPSNNAVGKMTCTVEFTDEIEEEEIKRQLLLMPFNPRYITHNYSRYTYPIQSQDTRKIIRVIRERLREYNIALVGRFAEWEYYNMDAAMASAMNTAESFAK